MNSIQIKQIDNLAELGQTYFHQGKEVVPSQFYARFSGKETKFVNRALDRISETGRLREEQDFFKISPDMVPSCHHELISSGYIDSRYGVTLLTRVAVNTLSHYFDDPNSVLLSKTVNSVATATMSHALDSMDSIEALLKSQLAVIQQQRSLQTEVEDIRGQISELKTRFDQEEINQFPNGCEKIDRIANLYFIGMSPQRVSQWLSAINHPKREYKHSTEDGHVRSTLVFVKDGLEDARQKLIKEAQLVTTTKMNVKYYHPKIGNFFVKRISHTKSFMESGLQFLGPRSQSQELFA